MSDRLVLMCFSDDGGRTWSDWEERSVGEIGEYNNRVQFTRLGSFTSRIWRVRFSSPIKTDLLGGQVNLRQTTR